MYDPFTAPLQLQSVLLQRKNDVCIIDPTERKRLGDELIQQRNFQ